MAISNAIFYVVPCARRSPITPIRFPVGFWNKPTLWDLATLALSPIRSKASPTPKTQSVGIAKAKSVGITTRSKILMDGNVAEGTLLEVYPKKGVRARWFMCVINGELRLDQNGDPFIALCYWCEENTTTLDKKYPPVPCPLEWVMRIDV